MSKFTWGCFRPAEQCQWAVPQPWITGDVIRLICATHLTFPLHFTIWARTVIRCQLSESSGIKCMLFFIQLLPAWSCIQMARSKVIELCIPFYSIKLAVYSKQGEEYWCHYQGSKGRKKCFLTFKVARCLHTLLRAKRMASFSHVREKILDRVNEQFLNPCPKDVLRTM